MFSQLARSPRRVSGEEVGRRKMLFSVRCPNDVIGWSGRRRPRPRPRACLMRVVSMRKCMHADVIIVCAATFGTIITHWQRIAAANRVGTIIIATIIIVITMQHKSSATQRGGNVQSASAPVAATEQRANGVHNSCGPPECEGQQHQPSTHTTYTTYTHLIKAVNFHKATAGSKRRASYQWERRK